MLIQGLIEKKTKKSKQDLIKQEEELLAKPSPIQDELQTIHEKKFELRATRDQCKE